MKKPKMIGINHVALEVGDIEEALVFYGKIFEFIIRHKDKSHAFIDLGDQFFALMQRDKKYIDDIRHFGLVVDNREHVRKLAEKAGATLLEGKFLDFLDPWGNRIQVVEYADIQFTKTSDILKKMGLNVGKNKRN
ncbi:VOC family protein [Legionella nagasakiensis]|uniref:VOC family protein n=1 Tax=Legionella nagasakiensis TaxID=535290 RepID=UPI0010564044|nr:VOC family protein [Legionella nagasakiensis]